MFQSQKKLKGLEVKAQPNWKSTEKLVFRHETERELSGRTKQGFARNKTLCRGQAVHSSMRPILLKILLDKRGTNTSVEEYRSEELVPRSNNWLLTLHKRDQPEATRLTEMMIDSHRIQYPQKIPTDRHLVDREQKMHPYSNKKSVMVEGSFPMFWD